MQWQGRTAGISGPATSACGQDWPSTTTKTFSSVISPSSSASSLVGTDRIKSEPFDFSDLVKATKPVESAISFPVIEWGSDDEGCNDENDAAGEELATSFPSLDIDDEEDEDELILFPTSTRAGNTRFEMGGGRRLRRSKSRTAHLSSLVGGACSHFAKACEQPPAPLPLAGSWGQFVVAEEADETHQRVSTGVRRSRDRRSRLARKSSPYMRRTSLRCSSSTVAMGARMNATVIA